LIRVLRILALNIFLSLLAILLVARLIKVGQLWFQPLPTWLELVAWPLFMIGSILIIWASVTLAKKSGASGAPGDPNQKLVDSGPYRWLRNPIYAGDVLLVFGVAFFTRSLTLLAAACLIPFFLDRYVRRIEEPRLLQRLGEPYAEYSQRVSRWIPKRTKKQG
jgi:protein-S-isoprenylcysteine O-methyltransferase Ste14